MNGPEAIARISAPNGQVRTLRAMPFAHVKTGLSNKSDFNDFTPARMNSGRGDFRFSGLVRQPFAAAVPVIARRRFRGGTLFDRVFRQTNVLRGAASRLFL